MWISVSPLQQSSFSVVSHNLLKRLGEQQKIYYLALHYYGLPQEYENYTILQFSDHRQITEYLRALRPEVTVIYQSPLFIKSISHCFDEIRMYSKLILYVPVEGYPITEDLSFMEKADLILTPSKFSQKCLEKEGYKAEVLYHGVDAQIFKPLKPLDQKFSEPIFKLGTIASHVWRKQITRLLDAYKLALQKGLENTGYYLTCTTYDSTKWMPSLNVYAQKMDIPVKISRTAYLNLPVQHETIASFYNQLHLHVLPTSESFGLPNLEAMACGAVPIVINHGAAPEIVGDCGLYAEIEGYLATSMGRFALVNVSDLADKIIWASQNREALIRLAKKAVEKAKLFTWDKAITQLHKLMRRLLTA